jgi:chromosome segregation ATPase
MLVIEIRGRQAEFIDHIHAARASLVSIAPLQTNVQVAGGYRARMDSEVSGLQNSRALLNIEDMRSRAERHLREIDSQIAQAQQSISGLQRKIYNLNNQYRACEGD